MPIVQAQIKIDKIKEEHINSNKVPTEINHTIPYKDWERKQKTLKVYEVPIGYCKYRLENGRIKTQILSHKKVFGDLDPESDETQKIISDYLEETDPTKNESLKKILKKEGQKEPAVITADGYLINGNRRKWAFEKLLKEDPDEKFKSLRVVILPGSNDPERPNLADIAILENRFQIHITGKSEYTRMNKALTYYHNTLSGISLEELLKDDPTFGGLDKNKFKQSIKKFKKEYFEPIKLMDAYLEGIGAKNDYNRVSNRWMSFEELAKSLTNQLENDKFLVQHNIDRSEIGAIKNAAFNLIKLKDVREVAGDNRYLIRSMKDWIKVSKKDVIKIGDITENDSIGNPDERDDEWQKHKALDVINLIKKLQNLSGKKKDQEDPLLRLNEALKKLQHEDLETDQLEKMKIPDVDQAFKLCKEIENTNKDLTRFFYDLIKKTKDDKKKIKKMYGRDA